MKKTNIKLYLLSLFLMFGILSKAQKANTSGPIISQGSNNSTSFCSSDKVNSDLYSKYPDRKIKMDDINAIIKKQTINGTNSSSSKIGTIYTIPVVVHVIHNNGSENISDAQVFQGVQDLNDGFSNQGAYQDANGTDIEIEFCMAQRDTNGNTTNGITRDINTLTNMIIENDDINLKNINRWNPNEYMNIWLVNSISSLSGGSGVIGYAHFPSSHGQPEDGLVCEASYFGSAPENSIVQIHEVGHYLGLYHTFQGGCSNNDCLSDGDRVCDTPPDNSTAPVPCNASVNTCSTDDDDLSVNNPFRPVANGGIGDQSDLIKNHMDYGDLVCHMTFTNGQKDRMRTALTNSRGSLLQSQGCTTPCTDLIDISFTTSATTVTFGTSVNFNSTSTGNITSYDWSINNTSIGSNQSASYQFNNVGNFWVVLSLNNSDPNCMEIDSVLITVLCDIQSTFTSSITSVNPGTPITFTSTTTGATSYQWYIDDVPQASTPSFINTFTNEGGYMVYLVSCNTNCCDTSEYQLIKVGLCESKEANMWYFGQNAGLDFNSGSPVAFTNSDMVAFEGCASIADLNGNPLMYTNGSDVWDATDTKMPNGTGLAGNGSFPSAQASIIVRQPLSNSIYYIFTTKDWEQNADGFHYSIVDMNQNGNLGDVTTKNVLIDANVSEQVTAVYHANREDIWIITHRGGDGLPSSNEYTAYLLTSTGLQMTPVISAVGMTYAGTSDNRYGYLRVSHDGKRICSAFGGSNNTTVELLDFDNCTGVISNPMTIADDMWTIYSCEFSPNNKVLYVTQHDKSTVFQYDLSSGVQSIISASKTNIATGNDDKPCVQMGPDFKIYVSRKYSNYLGVINNPNSTVNPDYVNDGVYLINGASRLGLPNFLADYTTPPVEIQGNLIICDTSTYSIDYNSSSTNCTFGADSSYWVLNGNSTIVSINDTIITIAPTQAGIDTLISFQYTTCGLVSDTILIEIEMGMIASTNLGNDTVICDTISLQLDAGNDFVDYLWSTLDTTQTINVNSEGVYWVEMTDTNGCTWGDTIEITQRSGMPPVDLGADTTVCPGIVIPIDAGPGYSSYRWQDFSNGQIFTAWLPGNYWVEVTDSCGNTFSDTIQIILDNSDNLSLGLDTNICDDEQIFLDAGSGYFTYLWQDGSTNQTYTVVDSGTYIVRVSTEEGCYYSDTVRIEICEFPRPTFVYLPNVFYTNSNNPENEKLHVFGQNIKTLELTIYDRWDKIVYNTVDSSKKLRSDGECCMYGEGWDGTFRNTGKPLNTAVFVYILKGEFKNGQEFNESGNITLIK